MVSFHRNNEKGSTIMFNRIWKFIKRNYVVVFFILFTLIYFTLSSYRHLTFSSTSLDLGSYTQTFWLYSNFEEPVNTVLDGRVPLGDHFEPFLIPLSMLYKVIPSPFLLFFLQSLAVSSIVFPLSFQLRKVVQEKLLIILFLFSTLTSFVIINAVIYDFHPLLIIAGLTAWLLYFMEEDKCIPMFIVLIIMLLLKETVGLLGILIGIYMLIRKKKVGIYVIAISLTQFTIAEKFVIPHFLGDQTYHLRYNELGESFGEIIKTIVTNPLKPIEILLRPQFLQYYAITILRFPLALFHPAGWVLILSNIAERFLSTESTYWGDSFHYGIMLVPILSFVSIKGIAFLKERINNDFRSILFIAVFFMIFINICQVFKYEGSRYLHLDGNIRENISEYVKVKEVLKKIPNDVSVAAQDNYVSHLANRKEIYKLVDYEKGKFVVIDTSKSHWPLSEEEYNALLDTISTDRYTEIESYKNLVVYIRNEKK